MVIQHQDQLALQLREFHILQILLLVDIQRMDHLLLIQITQLMITIIHIIQELQVMVILVNMLVGYQ